MFTILYIHMIYQNERWSHRENDEMSADRGIVILMRARICVCMIVTDIAVFGKSGALSGVMVIEMR